MSKQMNAQQRFKNGIADFIKEGQPDSYAFARCIDDSDPRSIKLDYKAVKETGNVVGDLIRWGEQLPCGGVIAYGDAGTIYKRDTSGSWTALRSVANSHGNGMAYFDEDDSVYYTGDKTIGRYSPACGTNPQFNDDYFASRGSTRLNTYSSQFLAASSQYASRADTATLSQTGDISIECYIKPASLPTTGNQMVFASKWDESGATRSYKFGISATNGYFGDGSDGALTISADTTDSPIDSACTGTSGTTTLNATNASFAAGQQILIHQSQGTGAGQWMRNKILGYTAGTITLNDALNASYTTGAQVLVLKQYTNVTINSGKTWTAKAWNGTVGGILSFLANGTFTCNGIINANGNSGGNGFFGSAGVGVGFRGGNHELPNTDTAIQGEGTGGASSVASTSANGNGGGGGLGDSSRGSAGGGGGNGTSGTTGGSGSLVPGSGGNVAGSTDLTSLVFGGGGGGGTGNGQDAGGYGGAGGGIVFISAVNIVNTGNIRSNGGNGGDGSGSGGGGAGGGAGGSILLKCQTGTLGSGLITASGGNGGSDAGRNTLGGAGGAGRIHIDYYTSYSGTTTPTLNATQDNTLVTNTGYNLFLSLSSTGSNTETLSRDVSLTLNTWKHVAVTWDASASLATFYLNGNSIGSSTGALTAIHDNASTFNVAMSKNGAGNAANFFNGKMDSLRFWNVVKSASDILLYKDTQIVTTFNGLKGYWKFNNDWTDSTANANDLTPANTPTFSDDVPFLSPSVREDIDNSQTLAGNTYTVPLTITESAANTLTFTPTKDPIKSISVLIASKGTGNWTLHLHDSTNTEIDAVTVTNTNLTNSQYEFTLTSPLRPAPNASYHFHLTSTVADGTVTTGTASNLSTVDYKTYYQFLVEDTEFHPVARMLNFLVFGNERYVAKYDATLYEPNWLTLPAGWRVRCFGYWREYLVIGCMKGDNIYDYDNGRLYFWDGISDFSNFFFDVPEGGINAVLGTRGKLFVWAGYQGHMMIYQGGDTADKIKKIPNISETEYGEVLPGAVTMWKTFVHFGVGRSDSTTLQKGIYQYGSPNIRYDESLGFAHISSTGNYLDTVKIGWLTVVNKKLLFSWQDGTGFGVDNVDPSNGYAPAGTIEFLIADNNVVWKEKEAISLVANFKPLKTGETVQIKYKLDRSDSWTTFPVESTVGATLTRGSIAGTNKTRHNEIQFAVDLTSTGATTPELLSAGAEVDMLESEARI